MANVDLVRGDCLPVLRELPDASVGGLVTDPPYCSGGTQAVDRQRGARAKYVSGDARHDLPDFPGDERDQRSFTLWCSLWLGEAFRVVRPGGSALVWTDWRQLPALSDALQAAGWRWRGVAVWGKVNPRPQPGLMNGCEYLLWGSRGHVDRASTPILPGWFVADSPRGADREHITAKPLLMHRQLVQLVAPGEVVLDPFAGSGTVGVAAVLEGRGYLGIEIDQRYYDIAGERVRAAQVGYRARSEQLVLGVEEAS